MQALANWLDMPEAFDDEPGEHVKVYPARRFAPSSEIMGSGPVCWMTSARPSPRVSGRPMRSAERRAHETPSLIVAPSSARS